MAAAAAMPLPQFGDVVAGLPANPTGSDPQNMGGSIALYFLSLEAYLTQGSDTAATSAAVASLQHVLTPGNEPSASDPLYGWSDGPLAAAIALLHGTPSAWSALGTNGQTSATMLVEAYTVSSNFAFNPGNSFAYDIGMTERGNASSGTPTAVRAWSHTYNPNYLGGPVEAISCAIILTASGCDAMLTGFNYATFTSALTAAGLNHIVHDWSHNSSTQITTAVKKPFSLAGHGLADPNGIFSAMAISGWGSPIFHGGTILAAQLCGSTVNAPSGNPVLGLPWEIFEFNTKDSKGPRADALYAYEAGSHAIYGSALLKAYGMWTPGPSVLVAMHNGLTDLFYKIEHGYNSCGYTGARLVDPTHPAAVDYPGEIGTDSPNTKGYQQEKAIWEKYLKF